MFDNVKEGELGLAGINKRLKAAAEYNFEVFGDIADGIEDLYDYVQTIEKEIQVLNTKLIDNTPEHVELVVSFIEQTTREISIRAIDENIKTHYSDFDSLKNTVYDLMIWKNEYIKIQDTTILKLVQQNQKLQKELEIMQYVMYWQSLPDKLIKEVGEKNITYNAYFKSLGWVKISEIKFTEVLSSNALYEEKDRHMNENFVEEITFLKCPLSKEIHNGTLFFDHL